MKLAVVRTPTKDFGLHGHMCCAWLEQQFPGVEFLWSEPKDFPPPADGLVLMGDEARRLWGGGEIADIGYVHDRKVFTYDIEEAWHFRSADDEGEESEEDEDKGGFAVRPSNRLFWVRSDVSKLLRQLPSKKEDRIITVPIIANTTRYLSQLKDSRLTIDIENIRETRDLTCIGLKTPETPAIVVPIYDYRGSLFYSKLETLRFFAALVHAMHHNIVVGHNLQHDLMVLASKYRLPFGSRLFDTMVMAHRVFPEIEKSLGHCIRLWLNHPWHKDENYGLPMSSNQQMLHWQYNGKDVLRTEELFLKLESFAHHYPAYAASMRKGCDLLYPYMLTTLRGSNIDAAELAKQRIDAKRRLDAMTRVCRALTGNKKFNPASSQQCAEYFHDQLGYKVIARTATGRPKADSKALYGLAAIYDNPLLRVIIAARESAKELSNLNFVGWKLSWQS